jgi:hypothetical protein
MKKTKHNLNEVLNVPPANGLAYTPNGMGNITPEPYTPGNYPATTNFNDTPISQGDVATHTNEYEGDDYEDTEENKGENRYNKKKNIKIVDEEDEDDNVTEVDEATKIQFRNALVSLLGENVSMDLVGQLEAVFEAAVQDRVNIHVQDTIVQVDENVKNYLNEVTANLVDKVDDYLDYVVEEWMVENTVAVEQGIKTQIAENFINGLKNLFENHYIDVPNDKYNALDEIYAQNRELEHALNNTINENMDLRKEISLTECAGIFVAETRDLADTQVSRLQNLMENVSFNGPDDYRNKLNAIKTNYLVNQNFVRPARPAPQQMISEEMTFSPVKSVENSTVDSYANVIGKLNKKI